MSYGHYVTEERPVTSAQENLGADDHSSEDAEKNIKELVSPHFTRGLMSLENFVLILDEAPHASAISDAAAQHIMPGLLDLANRAYKAFCKADDAINKINDKLDNDFLNIVVQEKNTRDRLTLTQASLAKLKENVKVLQNECNEVKRKLSSEEAELRSARESLQERQRQRENAEKERTDGRKLGAILGGIFGGPFGALAGLGIADAVHSTDVSNAEQAVAEASSRVTNMKRRVGNKEEELSKLVHEKEEEDQRMRRESQMIEILEERKEEIKKSQQRLAKLNESIKSCTTLVDTTTARAKMMADEANDQLPDIEAMLVPLKAVAGDLSEASLSNSNLLSGRFNMKQIGSKIEVITSKAMKSIAADSIDQWA